MSVTRIRKRPGRRKPTSHPGAKPVTLPTFSWYGHQPVIYIDGELVIGRRVIPLGRRP